MTRLSTSKIKEMKGKEIISVLTAYDYSTAKIIDDAGIDIILVGDSLGMVVLGYESTIPVTLSDMIHHAKAVNRAVKHAHLVVDMPFMTYHVDDKTTMENAMKLMQESGADSIKLEGGEEIIDKVKKLINAGVPVMGHLGLLPQSVNQLGGFKLQGTNEESAKKIINDALLLQEAGVYSIVLEAIPHQLAKTISESLTIPTIGIGAGVDCDGQVLVVNDMLGSFTDFTPKFVKKYGDIYNDTKKMFQKYRDDVKNKLFPSLEHSFTMSEEEEKKLYGGK